MNVYNMLVVDDNAFFVKNLINILCNRMENIRLYSIATSGHEAMELLKDKKVDIVLLDLKMPDFSGIEVLDNLSEEQKKHYEDSIILVSGELELIVKARDNKTVHGYVNKGSNIEDLIQKIMEIVDEKNKELDEKNIMQNIIEEVQYIGYNLSYKGTIYLVETIYYMIINTDKNYDSNLKKSIYPILAKKYNKSISNIKCNISNATDMMYCECERNRLNQYFKFYTDSKPKPKVVMSTIVNKIMNDANIY